MRVTVLIAFFCATALLNSVQAQKRTAHEADSLCRVYSRLAHQFTYENPDSALFYAELMYETAEAADIKKGMAAALSQKGILLRNEGKYEEALELFNDCVDFFMTNKDSLWAAKTMLLIGSVYEEQGKHDKQMQALLSSLEQFNQLQSDHAFRAGAHAKNHIGNAYLSFGEYTKALTYFKEAHADFVAAGDSNSYLGPVNNIGLIYTELDSLDLALQYLTKAYELNEKYTKNSTHRGQILGNIGNTLRKLGKPGDALEKHQAALKIAIELDQKRVQISELISIGNDLIALDKAKDALVYADSAISLSKRIEAMAQFAEAVELKIEVLNALKRFSELPEAYTTLLKTRDEILTKEKTTAIASYEVQFDTKQKENQLLLQERALLEAENESRKSRAQIQLLVFSLLVLAMLSLWAVFWYRARIRAKRLEVSLVEAELETAKLLEEKNRLELEENRKSLTSYSMILAQRNGILASVKSALKKQLESESERNDSSLKSLISSINAGMAFDNDWEEFRLRFEKVHDGFFQELQTKHPELTSNEERMLALLRLNLSRKQIASLLNISAKGVEVALYRIRKKVALEADQDLDSYLTTF